MGEPGSGEGVPARGPEERQAATVDSRRVLDALADPVVIGDPDGRIIYVNLAGERLLGWPDGTLCGQSVEVVAPEHLRDQILEEYRAFARLPSLSTPVPPVRLSLVRQDGAAIEVELTATMQEGSDGRRIVIVSLRDLSDRVELERQRTVSRYLRATAAAAARMTANLDFDYALRVVAETLTEDMGAVVAQVWLVAPGTETVFLRMQAGARGSAMPVDQIHWSALPLWLADVMRLGTPSVFRDPGADLRFDSAWVAAHDVAAVVTLPLLIAGGSRGVLLAAFDHGVSDEVLAVLQSFAAIVATSLNDVELFVREQEARAEAERAERDVAFLAEASRELATSLDYDTTLETAARLAVPYLADSCTVDVAGEGSDIRRVHVAQRDVTPPEVIAASGSHVHGSAEKVELAQVLTTGQTLLSQDAIDDHVGAILTGPDQRRTISYMRVPMVVRGRVFGVLSLLSSERIRRYGTGDVALAEDFARRVGAAIDNAELYAELQQAVRLRDDFLSTVSHDLKNPIAAIKGRAQLLLRRVDRLDAEDRDRFVDSLDAINSTGDRMVRLITDLVDIARLRSGAPIDLRRTPVDLVAIARRAADELQETTSNHEIVVTAPDEEVVGRWDGDRIQRVIDNLVSNAIKYSPDGGTIQIEIEATDTEAALRVRDRGVGIPAADLPRVFDRFYRGSNVGDTIPGSGIGLAGAQQLVHRHGGALTVESREGQGSTFSLSLPREMGS